MRLGREGKGGGAGKRLNVSLLNGGGRFACLRAIPVNIDVDVSITLQRISYKARGLDSLSANSKRLKSHVTPGPSSSASKGNNERLSGVKSSRRTREASRFGRFTALTPLLHWMVRVSTLKLKAGS